MQGRAPKEPVTVFIAMGDEAERKGVELVAAWRRAGIRVIEEFSAGGLKGRMKRADRLGADYVVILGENELASGVISVKDMKKAEQATVAWDRALEIISAQK